MTEDEAFDELERRLKAKQNSCVLQEAYRESAGFISDYTGPELATMSLRKAFELGYRKGFLQAKEGSK